MSSSINDADQRKHDPSAREQTVNADMSYLRSQHPDFSTVQASRPDWDQDVKFTLKKTKDPEWKYGDGATDGGESLKKTHVGIDPYEEGRPSMFNYKLLISGIIPRPIGFISTRSADGKSTNLAPYSYTSVINHDPPLFTIGIAGGLNAAKDTLRNLRDTSECTLNIISEHFLEAANATSINAPYGVSEWVLSGLHPAPCEIVSCSRVQEAVFSVEAKLVEIKEFESRAYPGRKSGCLAIIEGVRFWVREDAVNEERTSIDPAVLRPMSRMGGIMYGRVVEGCELQRAEFGETKEKGEVDGLIGNKAEGH